jgi:Fe-S-cluster containining protein
MQPLETNLNRIASLAAERKDEFEVLRYTIEFIEDDLPDAELDALVDAIATPVIEAIDCRTCANCCHTLDVYLTPRDVRRLADGLMIPVDEVIGSYADLESAAAQDEWGKFRHSPCVFLDGNRCTLYAHRPDSCRAYPAFTPDFRWTIEHTLLGAGRCPIIYHVLDSLIKSLDSRIYCK